tara:strand:- start:10423 stop:11667 length:1245 start_codon:yes stop_codon:yes gene_type:complete
MVLENKDVKVQQKNLIQSRAVISARKYKHLVLEWSTGCGKTLAAIKIIDEILIKNPNSTGFLICKESTHRKNWIEDIDKHGYSHVMKHTKMLLYASIKKLEKCDFIILDECHALTPMRKTAIKNIVGPNTSVIYLSATIPKEKKMLISSISKGSEKYYSISLSEAIELNLLPEPKVIVHRAKLNDNDKRSHKFIMKKGLKSKAQKYECDYHQRWNIFNKYNNLILTVKCNEVEYYSLLSTQMEYYKGMSYSGKPEFRQMCRNKFLNLGSQRKKFISITKTSKARSLVKKFRKDGDRFICFTGSIEQSLRLGANSSIHSKNNKDHNQDLIDCFNREECDELFAVKMLREGINLTNIQRGVIVQLDSSIGSFYQMLGRCLRHDFPEMHLLIIEDTQDEVYYSSAMKGFDKKFIKDG